MRQTRLVTGMISLLCAGVLCAQQDDRRGRIERELLEKQRLMREGRVVLANVRVTVRLDNGSRLRGVVRHGRFIERLDELDFVKTDQRGPDAGLRLWYYDNTNSYIFLPYDSIKNYTIGEKLTDIEVADIARRIEESRLQLAAARQDAPGGTSADARTATDEPIDETSTAPGSTGQVSSDQPETTSVPLTSEQRELLAEFPPDDGWGEARVSTIQTRQTTVGVYPSAQEKRFLEVFSAWQEARRLSLAAAQPKPAMEVGAPVVGGSPSQAVVPPSTPTRTGSGGGASQPASAGSAGSPPARTRDAN